MQAHHRGFLPIDRQPKPVFPMAREPFLDTGSLITRHHHEVVITTKSSAYRTSRALAQWAGPLARWNITSIQCR